MGVAELHLQLSRYSAPFLDTLLLIYLLEEHPLYVDLADVVMESIESGVSNSLTSTLTIAELLTAPTQAGDDKALRDYELYLTNFPNLLIVPLSVDLARQAARVRASTRLKMPDSIQIATALEAGADVVVGNDKRWRHRTGGLPLLLLDDFLDADLS
jgi:predicted nucleic acid-binding protein